jgi:hypothetical protein
MGKYMILFIAALLVLVSSCSEEKTFHDKIEEQYITATIHHVDKYGADLYVVEEDILTEEEKQEIWDRYIQDRMDQDHYLTMMNIREHEENPFHLLEEDRIEQYCEEEGFAACRTIRSTCDDDGCHRVIVSCRDHDWYEGDDYDYCNVFEVDVEPDIDLDLTDQERQKTCEDNDDDLYISLSCSEM